MKILFIGQSTFRLTLADGTVLLTDPWFKMNRLWRAVAPAVQPDEIGRLDFMLSSHNHLDHIDAPSLALAKAHGAVVIGSERVACRAKKSGVSRAVALKPGEAFDGDGWSVTATPAFHPLAKDAIGFLISADAKKIYFCGDTRDDPRLREFLLGSGPIDLAILQVACARYFGKDDGMNLETAAGFARAVAFKAVVPMHYHGRFKECDPHRLAPLLAGSGIETIMIGLGQEINF